MRFSADDVRKYPTFAAYLRDDVPELRKVNALLSSVKEFSGDAQRATFQNALRWDHGPVVKVVKDLGVDASFELDAQSQEINIDLQRVKDFENGLRRLPKDNVSWTEKGKIVYVIGVTLLHQLAHWVDEQTLSETLVLDLSTSEESWEFARGAYQTVTDQSPPAQGTVALGRHWGTSFQTMTRIPYRNSEQS